MLGAAASFSGAIISGGIIGWLVDGAMGSDPIGVLTGVLIGTALGMWELIRAVGSD